MDSDPWADAPSTPRPSSHPSTPIASPSVGVGSPSPSKAQHVISPTMITSPLVESTTSSESPAILGEVSDSVGEDIDAKTEDSIRAASMVQEQNGEDIEDTIPVEDEEDGLDDLDDFDAPAATGADSALPAEDAAGGAGDDDGFGDFGDFEEGDFEEPQGSGDALAQEAIGQEPPQERWHALSLRPLPSRSEMLDQLSTLLSPLLSASNSLGRLTDEPARLVGGLSQVLVGESSRDTYAQLTTAPMLKPLDWTRSRVRRDHLISMGVPVNLDEVDSHRLSALPTLRITTSAASRSMPPPARPGSLDASSNGRYTAQQKGKGRDTSPGVMSVPNSAGASKSDGLVGNGNGAGTGTGKYGLGQRPEMDVARAEELCGLEEDQLSILSIHALKKIQDELVTATAQASAALAWSLQLKDAQTQDSATYNGMISELIANAAKVKSAQSHASSGGVFRRASNKARPQSVSGTVTPRRTGSPGMW
ncbi:hypothetical protein IAR55_006614 [Kwoniella newhampshirensis]|uniref:Uncharacterized protein n=1 Tax=Kwoniella newhampshirensis TaxID=1651941 RepID=A0AAW0YUG0_9TREE